MKKFISIGLIIFMLFMSLSIVSSAETLPFENSAFFKSGDYSLHYRTYDTQDAKAQIMLLHGFGLSSESFDSLAKEYQSYGYKVVSVDFPNFGYSSRETFSTKLQSREELIYQLMKELGGQWNLGGHSMGGGIAINIAKMHPELVSSLVLFAPQSTTESKLNSNALLKVEAALFEGILGVGAKINPLMKLVAGASFSDFKFVKDYDISKISTPISKPGTGTGIAIMASHALATDSSSLKNFGKPICIITCDNDKIARKDDLKNIISNAGENAIVESVSKGGHMFMEYSPAKVAELTLESIVTFS